MTGITWLDTIRFAYPFEFTTTLDFDQCKTTLIHLNKRLDVAEKYHYRVFVTPSFQKFKFSQHNLLDRMTTEAVIHAAILPTENGFMISGKSYPATFPGLFWITVGVVLVCVSFTILLVSRNMNSVCCAALSFPYFFIGYGYLIKAFLARNKLIGILEQHLTINQQPDLAAILPSYQTPEIDY